MKLNDLYKKYSLVFLVLATCIGILATWYHGNRKQKLPTYFQLSPKKIFDSERTDSRLILLSKDSVQIKEDVYYVIVRLWNRGNTPIQKQDIKQHTTIKLSEEATMLDFEVLDETHPNVTKCTLVRTSNAPNSIIVNFDYLEKGNGIELALYYQAKDEPSVEVESYIADSDTPNNSFENHDDFRPRLALIDLLAMALSGILSYTFFYKNYNKIAKPVEDAIDKIKFSFIRFVLMLVLVASLLGLIVFCGYLIYQFVALFLPDIDNPFA